VERQLSEAGMRTAATNPTKVRNEQTPGEGHTVQSVVRACTILKAFGQRDDCLRLEDIATRCVLPKPTAHRLLNTLVFCGMLERPGKNRYRLPLSRTRRAYRLGYASESDEFSFSRLVSDSIRSSAYSAGVELLILNNRFSARTAIRNAEVFVHERVDFVIEFQISEKAASVISARFREANIPCLAIEIPQPDALYFGANNYRAGVIGGRALGEACLSFWEGTVDEVLLLELPAAGAVPRSRLTGTLAGLRELLPKFPEQHVRFLDGRGRFESSLEAVRRYLRRSQSRRVLISGVNDESCLAALSAFQEAGKSQCCLVVGQNANIDARQEMRRQGSPLIGSVGYFPEQYGEAIVSIALKVLQGDPPPPPTFVKHQLVTRINVDVLYPNDWISVKSGGDSLLYSSR
jgi:ribose transport system substrate-binding protein